MTRQEVIRQVKAKLEEFSPFEEPGGLLAVEGNNIKPTQEYIEAVLDKSFDQVLLVCPIYMVRETFEDISNSTIEVLQDTHGGLVHYIGYAYLPDDFLRLHSVKFQGWRRLVNNVISSDNPLYAQQRNPYTRGRTEKPVVAINDGKFEFYCIPQGKAKIEVFKYIPQTIVGTQWFEDSLAELLVLQTAINVLLYYEENQKAEYLKKKYIELLTTHTK